LDSKQRYEVCDRLEVFYQKPIAHKDCGMMPFSVLRAWTVGLLGWVVLAGGIYCLYEWADGVDSTPVRLSAVERPAVERQPAEADPAVDAVPVETGQQLARDRQGGWPYLAAAIGLIGISFLGWLPATLLLGKPGFGEPRAEGLGQDHVVERADGTRLHVQIQGPKNGPTLVFTHGWSMDRTAWYYATRDLKDRFRMVFWDLPGLGKSQGPANGAYDIDKMAGDLDAVIQSAGRGPIILVGHSIGGMMSQTFCRLHAQQLGPRVAGIVLVHTTYTNPLRTAFLAPLWTALERPLIVPLNHLTVWLAPLVWLSNWQSYLNGSLHMFTRFASFAGNQTWGQLDYAARLAAKAWPGVVARGNLAMLEFDEQATLPQVEIPVLVIASQYDLMTRPSASERIDQLLPHAMYATVPAGHLGLWEQHQRVYELIGEFAERFAEPAKRSLPDEAADANPLPKETTK
jgi:pimeloyl-ACP methyl ester carboxylesterase